MSRERSVAADRSNLVCLLAGGALLVVTGGCDRSGRISVEHAREHAIRLAALAEQDVDELRRGVPRGATFVGTSAPQKLEPEAAACRRQLEEARGADHDLMVAKSTFFALLNPDGSVVCSDQQPDRLRSVRLTALVPGLAPALTGGVAEAQGAVPEVSFQGGRPDLEWFIAAPIRSGAGESRGVFVSGWSYRRFAYHLEETLRHDLVTEALRAKQDRAKLPLLYAFVFTADRVFGAPVTPAVDTQALEQLDLAAKTEQGTFQTTLDIAGRRFALAAVRAGRLGPRAGVAVLRSET